MRRGLAKLAPPPSATFSTFSGAGGFGGGSGRGRGSYPSPPPPAPVPGEASSVVSDEDPFFSTSGRGRGRGRGDGPHPSSPLLPSFPSFFPSSSSQGRGRGMTSPGPPPPPPQNPDPTPKKPVFFSRDDPHPPSEAHEDPLRKPDMSSFVSALGRGKPTTIPSQSKPGPKKTDGNRHMPKREDAARRAMEILSRGGPGGGMRGRGRTGRGQRGMQGHDDGRRQSAVTEGDIPWYEMDEEALKKYYGDDGEDEEVLKERLKETLGEEKVNILDGALERALLIARPSPMEDSYQDAVHTNNMIEFEQEYLVNFGNPDIEEKPPMSLEEVLETAKPFLIAYEGISSQEEWETMVKKVMKKLPKMEEMMDMYCGPDLVTAKQQQEELQRVANTLPANAPTSVKKFTDRVVLSLQSNPGWGFDKKCQFMDKLAWEVNQHYK